MKKNDLINKRFGMLYVKSQAPDYMSPKGYRKSMWNCKCDCGKDCVVMGSHLTTGHSTSCGCQQTSKLSPRKANDLIGKKFGLLTVMYRQPNRMIKNNSRVVWHCKCECGTESDVLALLLKSGLVKSCGCLSISHAERTMIDYLDTHNIKYIFQYHPDNLYGIGGGNLSFDFALINDDSIKYLVELDGEQHFKSIEFFGGDRKYNQVSTHDKMKNEWANLHNIELIRIDVRNCKTYESFLKLYEDALSSYINELPNSLNI